ncbi:MAG: hypothetical protein IH859_03600 [Chloroflexi bacterium]|nr:hypothetical protein [Chloroflexota bacterium]
MVVTRVKSYFKFLGKNWRVLVIQFTLWVLSLLRDDWAISQIEKIEQWLGLNIMNFISSLPGITLFIFLASIGGILLHEKNRYMKEKASQTVTVILVIVFGLILYIGAIQVLGEGAELPEPTPTNEPKLTNTLEPTKTPTSSATLTKPILPSGTPSPTPIRTATPWFNESFAKEISNQSWELPLADCANSYSSGYIEFIVPTATITNLSEDYRECVIVPRLGNNQVVEIWIEVELYLGWGGVSYVGIFASCGQNKVNFHLGVDDVLISQAGATPTSFSHHDALVPGDSVKRQLRLVWDSEAQQVFLNVYSNGGIELKKSGNIECVEYPISLKFGVYTTYGWGVTARIQDIKIWGEIITEAE